MSASGWLDLALVIVLLAYALGGYRSGLVASVFSLAGFLIGGGIGVWLLPRLIGTSGIGLFWRTVALVGGTLLLASIGQGIGATIGARLRSHVRRGAIRTLDSLLGAVASVVVIALFAWLVAGAVRGALPTTAARAIGQSKVLSAINRVVPGQANQLFAGFQDVLDAHGYPRVFEGVANEPIPPVGSLDPAVVNDATITRAAGSIVKVTAYSQACNRGEEGSGWVVAPHRVVTNAHVVAGSGQTSIQVGGLGPLQSAKVVLFDPKGDLAILAVPSLNAPPLPQGRDAPLGAGTSAVVAGFPQDGPYHLAAARVRGTIDAVGADIYGNPGVSRQVYSLKTSVQPGNSGGPLLSTKGRVVGTVFAKSLDDSQTGYALTLSEQRPVLSRAAGVSASVSTGGCNTQG